MADGIGQAGVTGDVDQHYGRLLGPVLINGVLKGRAIAVQQASMGTGAPGIVASGIAQDAAQVGPRQTGRALNTSPTIHVPAVRA